MTACAGTNTIAALLAGAIDSHAAHALEHHLDDCPACRRLIAELGRGLSAIGEGPGAGGALPRIGERVGRFEIERVIGVGGMGVVFEARDPALERPVAVKLLRPDLVAGDALLAEAQAMARLSHPNIAVVHDVGRFGGQLYVCMEYVAGATLRAWLAERPRRWQDIAQAFVAAGRGLAYVHAAGLVHRDFKPDNVLVASDGRVVVTDFGLARVIDGGAPGHVVGTPAYMAPEQRRGERVDARADQYAFCAALREAIGARTPRWLDAAVARGMAARPADRFSSMTALLGVLEARLRTRPRPLARVAVVIAAAVVAALAVPHTREVVTRVIAQPVFERVVEARPALPPIAGEAAPEKTAADLAPGAADLAPAVAAGLVYAPGPQRAALADPRSFDDDAPPARPESPAARAMRAAWSAWAAGGQWPGASCDDGSERICPIEEPACPPTTVAALQTGCWTCADEHTCKPLGLPRSCDDGTRLSCNARPPACPGHDVPSLRDGCWACEDPFACRAAIPVGAPLPPRCGNWACEAGEDPITCPHDCVVPPPINTNNGSGNGSGSGSGSDNGSGGGSGSGAGSGSGGGSGSDGGSGSGSGSGSGFGSAGGGGSDNP